MDKQEKGKKDMVLARNRNGDLHMRQVRSDGWTEEQRALFLDTLAATCNVDASAAAAGHEPRSAKGLRRRDAGFAAAWDDALDTGYAVLEAMVLENAQRVVAAHRPAAAGGNAVAMVPAADDMTIRDAIALLDKHRAAVIRIRQGRNPETASRAASAKDSFMEIVNRMQVLKQRLDEEEG
jgi:hypothetical protein